MDRKDFIKAQKHLEDNFKSAYMINNTSIKNESLNRNEYNPIDIYFRTKGYCWRDVYIFQEFSSIKFKQLKFNIMFI